MSLKAKIEAVIYAAEEPVTLAQLLGLLGHEGAAELAQLDRRQQSLNLPMDDDEAGDVAEAAEDAAVAEIAASAAEEPLEVSEIPAGDPEELNAEALLADGEEPEQAAEVAAEEPAVADDSTQMADEVIADEVEVTAEAVETLSEGDAGEGEAAEIDVVAEGDDVETDPAKLAAREKAEEKRQAGRLREYFRELLAELTAEYAKGDRGLEIREVAGGYRFATKPEYHDAVRGFVRSLKPPLKLSLQALETLAVVAYKQPVTAPEVSEIRGVDSGGVLGSLMTRKLVATAGRKQVIGRPILYKTTKEFLLRFGLKDIAELPSIEEFEKMAGELADSEPVQEEIPMAEATTPETTTSDTTEPEMALPPSEASPSGGEHPAQPHETADELLHDDAQVDPAGHETEMADTHGAQADGTPDGSPSPAVDDDELTNE